jgi:hypothetical protein
MTASELTKWAITILEIKGNVVWRNNNLAVKGRKFIGRKGVPDIIGWDGKIGRAIWCEVKTARDRLSEHQINFLNDASKAGCFCYIAYEDKSKDCITLQTWADYRMIHGDKA